MSDIIIRRPITILDVVYDIICSSGVILSQTTSHCFTWDGLKCVGVVAGGTRGCGVLRASVLP